MTYPRIIYENLPYIYFSISGLVLTYDRSWAMIISAAMFYGAACITLVTRSSHRRRDRRKNLPEKRKIPELIYEYLPYAYLAVAIFVVMATNTPHFQFAGFMVIILAVRNLLCRHNNRIKSPTLF